MRRPLTPAERIRIWRAKKKREEAEDAVLALRRLALLFSGPRGSSVALLEDMAETLSRSGPAFCRALLALELRYTPARNGSARERLFGEGSR